MAATPADYQFRHGLRRKGITLACFILASTIVMGITAYVDSYSVHEWNRMTDVGPFAMSVYVYNTYQPALVNMVDSIRGLPGVEKAAYLERSYGFMEVQNGTYYGLYSGPFVGLGSDFVSLFPESLALVQGRLPANATEIAVQADVAHLLDVRIGGIMNYTKGWQQFSPWYLLNIVGIYSTPWATTATGYYYPLGAAIVDRSLLAQDQLQPMVFLDVDRTPVTAFDTNSAMSYLLGIETSIKALDSSYVPSEHFSSRFQVSDTLESAVYSFVAWRITVRFSQVSRGGAVALLVGLVMFLAIRFNVNDRRYENSVLFSRGASRSDLEHMIIREVAGLTVIGILLGALVGLVVSRIAVAATGFFEFDGTLLWREPFLVSIESIEFTVILGLVLPLGGFLAYKALYLTKSATEVQKSRLARAARLLALVRWDLAILVLTGLLMVFLYSAGTAIRTNPLLLLVATISPVALFIGLASLTVKGFRRGANWLSRRMSRIAGQVPSYGVRRIGKEASSAGPVAVLIILSLSIAWTYAIIGASIPLTKVNQARLAFGADITFHIDGVLPSDRGSFAGNVTLHPDVEASTALSVVAMMLSTTSYDYVSVVAMNPSEYMRVGYDYEGTPLNSSQLRGAVVDLGSTPNGVIITSDISTDYDLVAGDTIRASIYSTGGLKVVSFTILAVATALSDALWLDTGYEQNQGPVFYGEYTPSPYATSYYPYWYTEVGKKTMWTNVGYLASQLNLTADATSLYCVRTVPEANATKVAEDIINAGWNRTILSGDWASVTKDASGYLNRAEYRMDRSVDTLFTVGMILAMLAAFIVYTGEDIQIRRREVALLRAMGSDSMLVAKVQAAEMLVLAVSSITLVLAFAPILITNSLMTYSTSYYIFPAFVTPVLPWMQLAVILFLFLGSIGAFVAIVAGLSPRVDMATALNAAWAEANPYGGGS